MCNGESTRVAKGGSIAVLHPISPFPLCRTRSPSSSSSSTSSSSDDEIQEEETLLYFTNPLSKTSGTNVEMAGFDQQSTHAAWVVIQCVFPFTFHIQRLVLCHANANVVATAISHLLLQPKDPTHSVPSRLDRKTGNGNSNANSNWALARGALSGGECLC